MSRISPEQLRHFLAVNLLWKVAKEKLYERFGETPPTSILTQFYIDWDAWDAEDIEISAFLGKLSALAGENGWLFQVEPGFFDCLVPYLFGAIRELPKNMDGKAHWPGDCVCTVSEELFSGLPELFRESFDAFYCPVRVYYPDEKADPTEQAWTLLPKDEPLPYGTEPYGEWTPGDYFGGRVLHFCTAHSEDV